MRRSSRRVAAFLMVAAIAPMLPAAEVVVQNDSLVGGNQGVIQAGFDPGESGAAWLTSPCDGNIVAAQIFWRSTTATEPQSLEDSIKIHDAGFFPTPGTLLADIVGPVMTDGVFNEFRFLDENMTVPLMVPVTNGQTFVVSFRFFEDPNETTGPSLVNDTDGCQGGKNAIDAIGLGWINACLFIGGDWIIRAVVDCQTGGGSGSIPDGNDVPGTPLLITRLFNGNLQLTWEDSCSGADNDYEIYHGFLGAYYSHFSKICSTGGTMATFPPDMFDRYYLVVPTNGTDEGSYGRDSTGAERPQGGGVCDGKPQSVTCPVLP